MELLVVIAIIAILAAFLLPVLSAAKAKGLSQNLLMRHTPGGLLWAAIQFTVPARRGRTAIGDLSPCCPRWKTSCWNSNWC